MKSPRSCTVWGCTDPDTSGVTVARSPNGRVDTFDICRRHADDLEDGSTLNLWTTAGGYTIYRPK